MAPTTAKAADKAPISDPAPEVETSSGPGSEAEPEEEPEEELEEEVEEPEEEVEEEVEEEAEEEAEEAAGSPEQVPEADGAGATADPTEKWPGWPGDNVFRMIVPVLKVGGIIGPKGKHIKKLCEETRASVQILKGAFDTSERIVLITGREEPEEEVPPAIDAALRVFKHVSGLLENESGTAVCSVRLLMPVQQAVNLIGKKGSSIKSIQENSGAVIRVISGADLPSYASADERIVDIQGESLKVLKALEAVLGHLRKFLVDHSVIKLFEKLPTAPTAQDRPVDAWNGKPQSSIPIAQQSGFDSKSSFFEQENPRDSQIHRAGLSLYGEDPAYSGLRSSGLGRTAQTLVTQVTQTMQIPLSYAEDIIGAGGSGIEYIRRTSGAVVRIQESRGMPNEITVEIKGSRTEVQTAHQLIEDFLAGHKEPSTRSYGGLDAGFSSTYSRFDRYPSSRASPPPLSGYGYGYGYGYGGYRH